MDDKSYTKAKLLRRGVLPASIIVAIIATLWVTIRLTQPPELVCWASPAIDLAGHRVKLLVPNGWEDDVKTNGPKFVAGRSGLVGFLIPVDSWPRFMRLIIPYTQEPASIGLMVTQWNKTVVTNDDRRTKAMSLPNGARVASKVVVLPNSSTGVILIYSRPDDRAFERTYNDNCESLRIE